MLTAAIAFGIFLTIVLILEGGYYACQVFSRQAREARRVQERLQEWSTQSGSESVRQIEIVKKQVLLSEIPWLHEYLKRLRWLDGLRRLHERANSSIPFGTILLISAILMMLGAVVALHFRAPVLITLLGAGVGAGLPWIHLHLEKSKRMAAFQRQLPEGLELIARALRAGHAFFIGMKLVGEEMKDPIGPEFKQGFDEISMGISVPQALQNLADRVECLDMKFFVTSVNIQRETGGNLAEIIESLGHLIRKRFELQLKVKALSAEGRLSAIILFALPFVLGLVLHYLNPEYLDLLFSDPLGHSMLMVGGILMTIGAVVTKRMVAIEV